MPLSPINNADTGLVARNKINAGLALLPATNVPFNLANLGLVGDGVTDNYATLQAIAQITPTLTQSPKQTVTISLGSPADITLNNHGFLQGQPLVFYTTGALPSGLTAGTTYWVTASGLTLNTFRVSATWPNQGAGPDQTPINTVGPQSGTQSIAALGQDWVDVMLPPGNYVSTGGIGLPFTSNGIKKGRLFAYGTTMNQIWWSGRNVQNMATGGFDAGNTALINTNLLQFNQQSVTVKTLADASKFYVGQWALLMALDLQGVNSFPPNNHYFEYQKITSINTGTGEISFNSPLRNTYKDTYPSYGLVFGTFPAGGSAIMIGMNPYWDEEVELHGAHVTETGQQYGNCKSLYLVDCSFIEGQGPVPTFHKEYIAERCDFSTTQTVEIDKALEYVHFKNCTGYGILTQSTSVDRLVVEGCNFKFVDGTAKLTEILNSSLGQLLVGPHGGFGASEALLIENSRIVSFQKSQTAYDDSTQSASFNLVENFTWSDGTFSKPLTVGPISWAVPGAKFYIKPFDNSVPNMGSSFAIVDVRTDGVNTVIDTTLKTKPVGNSTNSVVTLTLGSPGTVNWNSHGLVAGTSIAFLTAGVLPTGVSANAVYYVSAVGGPPANSFQISATVSGGSINFTGSQSGTHTAISNPLQILQHPCPRVTVRNCTGSAVLSDMNDAPVNLPMFSYFKRGYIKNGAGPYGAGAAQVTQPYVWGNLVSMKINVLQAYGGATNPYTLSITAKGFDSSLAASDLSQTIDLRTVGLRTITPAAAIGSVGADTIAAYGDWISGRVTMLTNADNLSASDFAIFEIETTTDQGITKYNTIQTFGNLFGGAAQQLISDTSIPVT